MVRTAVARNVLFALLGVTALVLKGHYSGPFMEIVDCYAGNISASFAVYFIVGLLTLNWRFRKLVTAVIALLVVELFEVTNGFAVMSNVYDRADLVVNVVGVGLALSIDAIASGINTWRLNRRIRTTSEKGDSQLPNQRV